MRWMAWNVLGCVLWLAGLAYAKGISLVGDLAVSDGHQVLAGLGLGFVGLALLMWINLADAS